MPAQAMAMQFGGATYAPPAAANTNTAKPEGKEYRDVADLQREYQNYLSTKRDEINEKRQSRHYYHADQWTSDELKTLKARGQPKITKNRVGRKINGVVGLIERLRQDPKAYPRTPKDEDAAEIATAVIRYVLDDNRWEMLSARAARDGAVEGFGGIELELVPSKEGDHNIKMNPVAPDTFFYDARSFEPDFSDGRFEGVAKWADTDVVAEMWPQHADAVRGLSDSGPALGEDTDREIKWSDSQKKKVRLVDHWYLHNGQWCYCIYAASLKLQEGHSPFEDEEGKSFSKFIMYSAAVDHDGDRYGFVRNLKDTQDEVNHRYSKALHLLNTRRGMSKKGAVDVEKVRKEAMRADGWIEWDLEKPEFDDAKSLADMQGQLKFLEDAKSELENFGPNPALIGQGIENKSGRAIALLQQAGIAELGPYIIDYKDWKIRLYRAVWFTVRKFWTAERWIRVTDNEQAGQMALLHVNGLQVDPIYGPQTINAVASIDVDIIIDEGADTINMMADAFDTLSTLAARGADVPPGLLIELAPIQSSIKQKWLKLMEAQMQPDPMREQAKQIALAGEAAKVTETQSKTAKNFADAGEKHASAFKTQREGLAQPFVDLMSAAPPQPDEMFAGPASPQPPMQPGF